MICHTGLGIFSPILPVFHQLLHCPPFCFPRERAGTQSKVIGQQSCAYAYAYANHVLTGNNNDISISISIRGTQGFDILMLMLMLMSRLSSLAHKLLMLMLMLMLASLVRTRLKRYAQRPCFVGVLWGVPISKQQTDTTIF